MTRPADEAIAVAFAHGLPYAGLRDERHDSTLVPEDVARRARVVALHGDDERVRLAAAGPDPDLGAVREHLGARTVDVVIAPRDEIDAILGPPPPPASPADVPAPLEPVAAEPAPRREPAADGEEPSWLTGEPERPAWVTAALVLLAFVMVAGGIALAIWVAG